MGDGWSRDEYPDDWDSRRKAVYARDGHQCQNCGAKGGPFGDTELHCHHIVPKSEGGSHQKSNLTTLCRDCHNKVHDHHIPKMSEINSSSGGGGVTSFRSRSESNGPASQNLRRIGQKYGKSDKSAAIAGASSAEAAEADLTTATSSDTGTNSTSQSASVTTSDLTNHRNTLSAILFAPPDIRSATLRFVIVFAATWLLEPFLFEIVILIFLGLHFVHPPLGAIAAYTVFPLLLAVPAFVYGEFGIIGLSLVLGVIAAIFLWDEEE